MPLFIFEMANNHQGSVEHGKRIIAALREAAGPFMDKFRFAVKFQYRDLDTFIHPAMKGRADVKNVKRFEDTRLSDAHFRELLAATRAAGFLAVCTPFDEASAERIKTEGYDYIKIASCSFADWPLMEAIAKTDLPVIASAAGADLETIRKVVSFLTHRRIPLALMHCVGEYPTPPERLQMNQLDLYRREFPDLSIGFSTHEAPDDTEPVKIAVAKGARLFEKHVGVSVPEEGIGLNAYSANPEQVRSWLAAADAAFTRCGLENGRYTPSAKEASDLAALRRGVFVKTAALASGKELTRDDVYFAFPCVPGQVLAQDFSKYARIILHRDLTRDAAVMRDDVRIDEERQRLVAGYVAKIVAILKASNAVVPAGSTCDISHHYGLENYEKTGVALIECVNREYCKKILVLLPGQKHPTHRHSQKEETFLVLHGDLKIRCGDIDKVIHRGETITVERNTPHDFSSDKGCVFEEISSTHFVNDSYYDQEKGFVKPRKTAVFLTRDVLG